MSAIDRVHYRLYLRVPSDVYTYFRIILSRTCKSMHSNLRFYVYSTIRSWWMLQLASIRSNEYTSN